MKALFGLGLHPNAAAIVQHLVTVNGLSKGAAMEAAKLGRPFQINDGQTPLRPPQDARELSGFVARGTRELTTSVAGYDLTFSPVKSVSALWAIAPIEVSKRIEAAHDRARRDAPDHLQTHAGSPAPAPAGSPRSTPTDSSPPCSPIATAAPATPACTAMSRCPTRSAPTAFRAGWRWRAAPVPGHRRRVRALQHPRRWPPGRSARRPVRRARRTWPQLATRPRDRRHPFGSHTAANPPPWKPSP